MYGLYKIIKYRVRRIIIIITLEIQKGTYNRYSVFNYIYKWNRLISKTRKLTVININQN